VKVRNKKFCRTSAPPASSCRPSGGISAAHFIEERKALDAEVVRRLELDDNRKTGSRPPGRGSRGRAANSSSRTRVTPVSLMCRGAGKAPGLAQPGRPAIQNENVVSLDLVGLKITEMRSRQRARPLSAPASGVTLWAFTPGMPARLYHPDLDGGTPGLRQTRRFSGATTASTRPESRRSGSTSSRRTRLDPRPGGRLPVFRYRRVQGVVRPLHSRALRSSMKWAQKSPRRAAPTTPGGG